MVHRKVPNWAFSGGVCVCVDKCLCLCEWVCIEIFLLSAQIIGLITPKHCNIEEDRSCHSMNKNYCLSHYGEHWRVGGWAEFSSRLTGCEPGLCKWKWTGKGREKNACLLKDTIKILRSILMLTLLCKSRCCVISSLSINWFKLV